MDRNLYKDIAPYVGQDAEEAVLRLQQYPQFLNNMTDIICHGNHLTNKWRSFQMKKLIPPLLNQVHSYDDFQKLITCGVFLNVIENNSIDEFTFNGIDKFTDDRPHLYISNHRDIVLDCALLDLALYRSGKQLCEMAIGDNLLVNQFVVDMFKLNGGITVKRSLTSMAELREETKRLSRYLTSTVTEGKSVWIAQKSGRSKDGKDDTSAAVVKMLYLASKEDGLDLETFVKNMSIVPVAISYQFDPCDISKSHEEIKKLRAEGVYNVYKKKKYADILDLVRGLRMPKGNVHIEVGTELGSGYQNAHDVVREIDRQIHQMYRLWDSNYFAYDHVNGSHKFAQYYEDFNFKKFIKHYHGLNDEVVDFVFRSYANPVQSMLNENE